MRPAVLLLDIRVKRGSARVEGLGRTLLDEGARGFLKILRQVELVQTGVTQRLLLAVFQFPATLLDAGAHRQRRVLVDGGSQLAGDVQVLVLGREAVDDTGLVGLGGIEEADSAK